MKCEICYSVTNKNQQRILLETPHWLVSLADDQYYLGRCYVTAKRHVGSLSELTSDEFINFHEVVKSLEGGLKSAFNATLFNWSCLLNNAFKETPAYPHVHWHFRPRYRVAVNVAGLEFKDSEFGHHYNRDATRILPDNQLDEIARILQKEMACTKFSPI